jgi:uncharacterized membrane protein
VDKKLYWASIVFTVIGLAVSIYMTIYKLTDDDRMCAGSGGCSTVNSSPYAEINGFPVAAVGVLGYLAILFVLVIEVKGARIFRQNATLVAFGLTLNAFLYTLYLIYLEIFVIKAICPFCVTSQIAMTILFMLSLARIVKQPPIEGIDI